MYTVYIYIMNIYIYVYIYIYAKNRICALGFPSPLSMWTNMLHRSTIRAELRGLVEVLETSLYNLKLEELMAASPWP